MSDDVSESRNDGDDLMMNDGDVNLSYDPTNYDDGDGATSDGDGCVHRNYENDNCCFYRDYFVSSSEINTPFTIYLYAD